MTEQQKIQKAQKILMTVGNLIAEKLVEVDQLLTTSPAQGKKTRKNLKNSRMMEVESFYSRRKRPIKK